MTASPSPALARRLRACAPASEATLEALFEAVEIDDIVDPVVSLPDPIPMDYDRQRMEAGFGLCLQFWHRWADRGALLALVHTLLREGDLAPAARRDYKNIRAAYKQLRFALVLYSADHQAPKLFKLTVALMGLLQDAFRGGRRGAVLRTGLALRLLLSAPLWAAVENSLARTRIDDAAGFLAFRKGEMRWLRAALEKPGAPNGHVFHKMRKVVSRQVSFYDTMRTLAPNAEEARLSRFLSAINGLMGRMHDDMVEQAAAGTVDYGRHGFPLPDDLRRRLETLVEHYPA